MIKTKIACDGLLARLGEEIIESYDTGDTGIAVDTIVTDLLAFQRKATKITKGTIGVSGTRALKVANKTILAAFLQLQESVGGYLYIDNNWALQWPTTIGEDKGQQIRYRKNLIGIERDIDYEQFCTKLHPESSDELLSDISIGPVDVDIDTDATYGYITLKETYACYKDWAGEGYELPSNIIVYKQNASPQWIIASAVDSAPGWSNTANTKDDDWDTCGKSNAVTKDTWTAYITCSIASGWYNKVKFKADEEDVTGTPTFGLQDVQIDIYDGADWLNIYDSRPSWGNQVEVEFAGQQVTKFRVRAKSDTNVYNPYSTVKLGLYECQFLQSDVADDSSVWESGENERTLRCAIADWDGAATYQIAYTYADYLIAWDKITTADDIVARVVTNKYEVYSLSLLEAGILMLDELKVAPITYAIDTLDLSKCEDWDFDFDALQIGSVVQVVDEDLGIDVSVRVIKLEHPDLLNPERMQLQLSTRVKDISDYLADLHKEF